MMRELDTVSPVVWPAWCYSGEGQLDTEAADATVPSAGAGGRKGGGRGGGGGGGGSCTPTGAAMNGAGSGAGTPAPAPASASADSQPSAAAVKTERLSPQGPSTPGGGGGGGGGQQGAASSNSSTTSSNSTANQHHQSGGPDNNSTSSRSGTPGSSYPGTPPERAASPHPLKTEHLARNYSDFMRSLAAKYNNANPNDYLSSAAAAAAAAAATGARNGYLEARFAPFKAGAATPFVGLMAPLAAPASPLPGVKGGPAPAGSPKEELPAGRKGGAGTAGAAAAGAGAGGPPTPAPTPAPAADLLGMFPPMIDMSSTQALLSMVRSANASQLENYLKGASSRRPAESSPLDLSPGAVVPPPAKRRAYHAPSRSIGESLFASKDTHRLRRLGSVSPKPRPPAPPTAAPAAPARVLPCPSLCGAASAATCAPDAAATAAWTVDDVAAFVGSIDLCAEYAQNFREQRIDGCALPLLTEEHLTGALGMRLGPALKLRAALSRRLGQCAACAHCLHCHAPQPQPPSAGHSPTSRPASTGV